MPGPDWLYFATAGVLAAVGVVLLYWSLFHDRSKGRRRCPKCWYDMAGAPGLICPECGHSANSERSLGRTRRRWRWFFVAAAISGIAIAALLVPKVRQDGVWSCFPTLVLIAVDATASPRSPSLNLELDKRLATDFDQMWEWQRRLIVRQCVLREFRVMLPTNHALLARTGWQTRLTRTLADGSLLEISPELPSELRGPWKDGQIWRKLDPQNEAIFATALADLGSRSDEINYTQRCKEIILRASVRAAGALPESEPRWQTLLVLDVTRVDSVDQILSPVDSPAITEQVKKAIAFRLTRDSKGRAVVQVTKRGDTGTALALSLQIEFIRGGKVEATATGYITCDGAANPRRPAAWEVWGPVQSALSADTNDKSWTVRIRGDGVFALHDFAAMKYWSGEFTLPLSEVRGDSGPP